MDEAKRELVQSWLIKAQHDLVVARKRPSWPASGLSGWQEKRRLFGGDGLG
jgi:hypothetical protein